MESKSYQELEKEIGISALWMVRKLRAEGLLAMGEDGKTVPTPAADGLIVRMEYDFQCVTCPDRPARRITVNELTPAGVDRLKELLSVPTGGARRPKAPPEPDVPSPKKRKYSHGVPVPDYRPLTKPRVISTEEDIRARRDRKECPGPLLYPCSAQDVAVNLGVTSSYVHKVWRMAGLCERRFPVKEDNLDPRAVHKRWFLTAEGRSSGLIGESTVSIHSGEASFPATVLTALKEDAMWMVNDRIQEEMSKEVKKKRRPKKAKKKAV